MMKRQRRVVPAVTAPRAGPAQNVDQFQLSRPPARLLSLVALVLVIRMVVLAASAAKASLAASQGFATSHTLQTVH